MSGDAIAAAAQQCLGAPFRLHGRDPATGLDCVGLVGWALGRAGQGATIPVDYGLRGMGHRRVVAFAQAQKWQDQMDYPPPPGTILLMQPGPAQIHLGIISGRQMIHAHAGLRRVVAAPLPPLAAIAAMWRVPDCKKG